MGTSVFRPKLIEGRKLNWGTYRGFGKKHNEGKKKSQRKKKKLPLKGLQKGSGKEGKRRRKAAANSRHRRNE